MDEKSTTTELDFMDKLAGQGFEGVSADNESRPFLKLAQDGTKETKRSDSAYVEGLEPGMFFNSLTKKNYGKSVDLIPVRFDERWNLWTPTKKFAGSVRKGTIEVTGEQFGEGGLKDVNGNRVQDAYTMYVLISGHLDDGILVYVPSSMGIKHMKNWITQIGLLRTPKMKKAAFFLGVWTITSIPDKNAAGAFYNIGVDGKSNIVFKRYITEKEALGTVIPMHDAIEEFIKATDFGALEDNSNAVAQIAYTPAKSADGKVDPSSF